MESKEDDVEPTEATVVAPPTSVHREPPSTNATHETKPSLPTRKARKGGMMLRRRPGLALTIEATANRHSAADAIGSSSSDALSATAQNQRKAAAADDDDDDEDAIPWWILEYQCPPPGHLGVHNVPVAAQKATAIAPPPPTSLAAAEATVTIAAERASPGLRNRRKRTMSDDDVAHDGGQGGDGDSDRGPSRALRRADSDRDGLRCTLYAP